MPTTKQSREPGSADQEYGGTNRLREGQIRSSDVAAPGNGIGSHLAAELFRLRAGVNMTHLPHNAASQATPDPLAGSIDLMFMFQTSASPQIKAGKPRAHAVSTATRTPAAPDTPVQFAALFHRQMPTRARVVRDAKLRATN
jgi:hypothetical protein